MSGDEAIEFHGGRLIARRLRAAGVSKLFTLSGGHLFSIYDGCREEGIDLVDVRHEQTAAFAAEGWAKVTRTVGVCALTAGPGVTNGMSAIASASQNQSPILVLGGRAPAWRWGQGSLQELDHVPFVRPLVKFAATAGSAGRDPGARRSSARHLADAALRADVPGFPARPRLQPGRRERRAGSPGATPARAPGEDLAASPASIDRAAALLREAERPVIMAGTGLYWAHGEPQLLALAEELADTRVPQRTRAGMRAGRSRAVLLARARRRVARRRCGAGDRRAARLQARLR